MQIKVADGRQADIVALERILERPDLPAATRKRIDDVLVVEVVGSLMGAHGDVVVHPKHDTPRDVSRRTATGSPTRS
ncbi:MAG: hypothetical protein H0V73_08500 [Chloroflexi bacterium]|nr:hypothetical protein [Chloroflexota bacterium]